MPSLRQRVKRLVLATVSPIHISNLSLNQRRIGRSLLFLMIAGLAFAVGCDEPEGIRTYTVKKQLPSDRMLAAIIPNGEDAWFFKMTGPNAAVASQEENFNALLKSVKFSDPSNPQWQLPIGWHQHPADRMRFATLEIEADGETFECTVSKLPRNEQPLPEFLLANINRWRGQMRQPPLEATDLDKNTSRVALADDKQATVVNIVGTMSSGGMGAAPFAGGAGGGSRPGSAAASRSPGGDTGSDSKIAFEKPASWSEGQLVTSRGGISVRRDAAFDVNDGDKRVEITVTKLPGAAGATLPNVNRWRGQIGLEPIDADQLAHEKKEIEFGGSPADYVQFIGSQQAVLGVVAERQGLVWFVKLQGDSELAGRERQNFENFVKSIRWE